MIYKKERGSVDSWMIATIGLVVLVVAVGALAVWALVNYNDQKTDVDAKISSAVAVARKEQADSDEVKFAEREKEPNREFVGPDDYGHVTFNYPKTWSVYIEQDGSDNGSYEAYLNPVLVPAVNSDQQQYALRVVIEQVSYDDALNNFDSLVQSGDLKSSSVSINGSIGTRLDGKFSDDIRGSMIIFKIRDKVLTIRTDADTFKPDFNALITTLKFNK